MTTGTERTLSEGSINWFCAVGSLISVIVGILVFCLLLISVGVHIPESWPRIPEWIGVPCQIYAAVWLASLLYPKCRRRYGN